MIASIPATQPLGTAIWQKATRIMDVILHIGAHRCATTSFQTYLRSNRDTLIRQKIGFWGPKRTRSGLFAGLQPGSATVLRRDTQQRAIGRVRMGCAMSAEKGIKKLIVSDENMLGTMRANLRMGALYCGAGERMARFAEAFGHYVTDVVLNIRSLEFYWASAMGYRVAAGDGVPRPALMRRLAAEPRSWRDVVTDVACAMPDARIHVLPFERFAGRPDAQLSAITGDRTPETAARVQKNATPDLASLREMMGAGEGHLPKGHGRWMPFGETERAQLRETYADDLMWLTAGADGLAHLVDETAQDRAGTHPPTTDMTRGRRHERRHIQVAHAGRKRVARQTG